MSPEGPASRLAPVSVAGFQSGQSPGSPNGWEELSCVLWGAPRGALETRCGCEGDQLVGRRSVYRQALRWPFVSVCEAVHACWAGLEPLPGRGT